MPRTLTLEPYQFCGETLYLSDRLIEIFDDVVADLGLDERPIPPRPSALVEWSRTLRLHRAAFPHQYRSAGPRSAQ